MSRWERFKYTIVQPGTEPDRSIAPDQRSVEELEDAIARSDDKERTIGLVAAPLAALIALLVGGASVNYAKTHHLSTTLYSELTYMLLVLAVLILVMSLLRKRLFQGITLALFGLAVFNLKAWGFGFPFVLAGAWYLVRAYRLQQSLKRAEGGGSSQPNRGGKRPANGSRPRTNKRYTPPT
jgi:hypothetical protein